MKFICFSIFFFNITFINATIDTPQYWGFRSWDFGFRLNAPNSDSITRDTLPKPQIPNPKSPPPQYLTKKLTQTLIQNIDNDSLKVKAIYDWVTSNIQYDRAFRHRIEGDTTLTQEPDYVIGNKKAVCIGYSKLIKEMCRIADIQAVIVGGFVKNEGHFVENEEHAWNAVKINNNWYLLDATWDAGNGFFSKKYFLADPSVFQENHLPHDPLWQLVKQPLDFDCFINNKNCFNEHKTLFNFKDSITVWENLDSMSRAFNEAVRILNYNEKDVHAMRQLAEYYSNSALNFFKKYADIRQAVKEKKGTIPKRDELLMLLNAASNHLENAKGQYQRILPFAKRNRYTDAHINIEVMDENLANIELEKAYVLKYFKN